MRLGTCSECTKLGPITPVLNEGGLCSTCWSAKNTMKETIKSKLSEEITRADVKKDIKNFMDSSEFKSKVERIVKDRLKNEKELEDKIVDITKNVITQLYKTLWSRRGMWQSQLKNQKN